MHPTDRIADTMAFVTPVMELWLEREIAQWVHPMKDRSDAPSHHERMLLPRSYVSLWTDIEYKLYFYYLLHCITPHLITLFCMVRAFAHGAMGRRIDP